MKVIEHRVNLPKQATITPYAEIDIHVGEHGRLVVKHDLEGKGWDIGRYIHESSHEKFFVDIKQNLDVVHYQMIINQFGERLLGIFDVPFPSAYFASQAGIEFYGRLSEFELAPMRLVNKYWVDPLSEWDDKMYRRLTYSVGYGAEVILACPSLHEKGIADCDEVWKWMRDTHMKDRIEGIVTKHPKEFMEVFHG